MRVISVLLQRVVYVSNIKYEITFLAIGICQSTAYDTTLYLFHLSYLRALLVAQKARHSHNAHCVQKHGSITPAMAPSILEQH
jgi:hypothetical protein